MTRPASSLALLLVLLGGWAPSPATGPLRNPDSSTLLWVFLSPEAWSDPQTMASILETPARVRFQSEWLQAVSVELHAVDIPDLQAIPGVLRTRPVGRLLPLELPSPERSESPLPQTQSLDSIYGALGEALDAVGIPQAHSLGFSGSGVRLGILDGTFLDEHETIRERVPLAARDFVDLDDSPFAEMGDPPGAASHGTALWSILSADLRGVLKGGAPRAEILLARIRGFDALTPVDEDRWVAGLEWLESQGARIVLSGVTFREFSGSSHSIEELNGDTTPATQAADEAARRGVLVVAPVGNNGPAPQSLEAPADGDSVLAVGAASSLGTRAVFSASGPTFDGRRKPELYGPGLSVEAASGANEQALERFSGTEFAGAIISGALALAVEAYPGRGPMELVELLRRSAPPDQGTSVGLPDAASAILFPDGLIPLPVQEVGQEGEVTNLAPQFQWTAPTLHPLGLPVTFFVEMSEDSLFRSLALSDSVLGTFARRPHSPLPPRTRLYWRVRARSVQGVERISVSPQALSVPSWVTLEVLNEPSGSEIADPQPEFRWRSPEVSSPAGPLIYELQILSDRESELIQSYSNLSETEFQITEPLPFNLPLRWRVIGTARSGVADTATSAGPFVVTSGAKPPATILYQNFPNPFPNVDYGGMETRIWFDLAEEGAVELAVYDMRGRLVRSLIPARGCPQVRLAPGIYGREPAPPPDQCVTLSWDGRDDRGRQVNPGVYLLRLRAGGVVDVRRVVYWP